MTSQRLSNTRIFTASALSLAVLTVLTVFAASATAQNPVPFLDQPLVPDATAPGGPGFTLTVNGTGFVSTSVVNWNGSPRTTTFVTKSQLTATILPSDIATASTATVTVVSPNPGGGVSNTQFFSIAAAAASVSFLPAVNYNSGGIFATQLAVADINGDGKPDLVVGNGYDGSIPGNGGVGVLLGNGDGTFQPVVTHDTGGPGSFAVGVLVTDVNGDGKPDLIVANSCGDSYCLTGSTVAVLMGNGDGTFQPPVAYSSGGIALSLKVADVNNDGKLDIVVANADGSVGVLLGNGDGTFQPVQTFAAGGSGNYALALVDLNGDGKLDVVVSILCFTLVCSAKVQGGVGVLLGNGDGTFQPAVTYPSTGFAVSLAAADVNNDGKPDLVVINEAPQFTIAVLLGNGDGTFQSAVTQSAGQYPSSIAIADVNGDGAPDLVVALGNGNDGEATGAAGVLIGNGNGTFRSVQTFGTLAYVSEFVAVADVNGDGRPDVLVVNSWGSSPEAGTEPGSVSVLLNNSVAGGPTTTTLVSSLNPSTYGQTVTFTASVTSTEGTPTGTVIFYDGLTSIGSATLSSGSAAISASSLAAASHSITAAYQGSSTFGSSTSAILTQVVNGVITTTTLASSQNPSTYGQTVTLTASVNSTAGTPTGTVIFYDGLTSIGSATLSSGKAAIAVSSLAAGSHSITAAYQGSVNFSASTSAAVSQTVKIATTTTSLTSSVNPAGTSQSVTFTATVTSQFGGAATGSVTFYSGTQTLGTATVSGNRASLTTSFSTSGTYSISAKYNGDGNNSGSTSPTLSQVIIAATTTTLTSSLNPSVVGQAVTFTATVSSTAGAPPNGELITFKNGSSVLGTAALSGGSAALTTSSLPAGTDTITATYAGDANFSGSTSPGLRQAVNNTTKSTTSTTLSSSLNPSIYGQSITFKATVTTTGSIAPTGSVNFTWSGYSIGTATLNASGIATLTKSNLNVYTYPLTAVYSGDANNAGSTSAILNQVVKQTTSAATLTSSPNPSTQGQAVTFTAKITSPTVVPTGPVTFKIGNTVLGTAQLSAGKATFTTSTLPAGSTIVTVTYPWNSNIAGSSASVTQTVQP